MTEPEKPSIVDQIAASPNASAIAIIQAALPAVAEALVALALAGSVQAAALCLKLGDCRIPAQQLLERAIAQAPDSIIVEILDLLSDRDIDLALLTHPVDAP